MSSTSLTAASSANACETPMRPARKLIAALMLPLAALAACTTTEDANRALQSRWIGQPAERFFAAYGPPIDEYPLSSGKIYTWRGGDKTRYIPPVYSRPEPARTIVRTNTTVIAALSVKRGEADAMLCGLEGRYIKHVRDIRSVLGLQPGVKDVSALSMLIMPKGAFFLTDTYVNVDPTPEEIVSIALQARDHLKRFNRPAICAIDLEDGRAVPQVWKGIGVGSSRTNFSLVFACSHFGLSRGPAVDAASRTCFIDQICECQ